MRGSSQVQFQLLLLLLLALSIGRIQGGLIDQARLTQEIKYLSQSQSVDSYKDSMTDKENKMIVYFGDQYDIFEIGLVSKDGDEESAKLCNATANKVRLSEIPEVEKTAVKVFNPLLVENEDDKVPEFIVASVRVLRGIVTLDSKKNLKVHSVIQGASKFDLNETYSGTIENMRISNDYDDSPYMEVYETVNKTFVYMIYENQAILFYKERKILQNLTAWPNNIVMIRGIYIVDNMLLVAAEKQGVFSFLINVTDGSLSPLRHLDNTTFPSQNCDIEDVKGKDGLPYFFILDKFTGLLRVNITRNATTSQINAISLDTGNNFNITLKQGVKFDFYYLSKYQQYTFIIIQQLGNIYEFNYNFASKTWYQNPYQAISQQTDVVDILLTKDFGLIIGTSYQTIFYHSRVFANTTYKLQEDLAIIPGIVNLEILLMNLTSDPQLEQLNNNPFIEVNPNTTSKTYLIGVTKTKVFISELIYDWAHVTCYLLDNYVPLTTFSLNYNMTLKRRECNEKNNQTDRSDYIICKSQFDLNIDVIHILSSKLKAIYIAIIVIFSILCFCILPIYLFCKYEAKKQLHSNLQQEITDLQQKNLQYQQLKEEYHHNNPHPDNNNPGNNPHPDNNLPEEIEIQFQHQSHSDPQNPQTNIQMPNLHLNQSQSESQNNNEIFLNFDDD